MCYTLMTLILVTETGKIFNVDGEAFSIPIQSMRSCVCVWFTRKCSNDVNCDVW